MDSPFRHWHTVSPSPYLSPVWARASRSSHSASPSSGSLPSNPSPQPMQPSPGQNATESTGISHSSSDHPPPRRPRLTSSQATARSRVHTWLKRTLTAKPKQEKIRPSPAMRPPTPTHVTRIGSEDAGSNAGVDMDTEETPSPPDEPILPHVGESIQLSPLDVGNVPAFVDVEEPSSSSTFSAACIPSVLYSSTPSLRSRTESRSRLFHGGSSITSVSPVVMDGPSMTSVCSSIDDDLHITTTSRSPRAGLRVRQPSVSRTRRPSEPISAGAHSLSPVDESFFPLRSFEYRGWEFHEADFHTQKGYFVHQMSHTIADLDFRSEDVLERVAEFVDGDGFDVPPVGWEAWLVDKDEDGGGWKQLWVHHGRKTVSQVYPDVEHADVFPDYFSYEERLDADFRYWTFVQAHPSHVLLSGEAMSDAMDALTLLHIESLHLVHSPELPTLRTGECQKLLNILRFIHKRGSAYRPVTRTRIIAQAYLRIIDACRRRSDIETKFPESSLTTLLSRAGGTVTRAARASLVALSLPSKTTIRIFAVILLTLVSAGLIALSKKSHS